MGNGVIRISDDHKMMRLQMRHHCTDHLHDFKDCLWIEKRLFMTSKDCLWFLKKNCGFQVICAE